MADGSIIIDARLNKKGAESDLKALQAKAKSTAQQIAAVDKQLGGAIANRYFYIFYIFGGILYNGITIRNKTEYAG